MSWFNKLNRISPEKKKHYQKQQEFKQLMDSVQVMTKYRIFVSDIRLFGQFFVLIL